MKIMDEANKAVNAEISVISESSKHQIVIESSGGGTKAGRPRRNPEYNKVVSIILSRIKKAGTDITGIYLDSRKAKKDLSINERLVCMEDRSYPISAPTIEPESLRGAIGKGVVKMMQSPETKKGGCTQKKILIKLKRHKNEPANFLDAIKSDFGSIFPQIDLIDFNKDFEKKVQESARNPSAERQARLANRDQVLPEKASVTTTVYKRNADVVAQVLERAAGLCEKCQHPAPFKRSKDGKPYLEVHHWIYLADGGEDTVANAGALCPNCHREAHFG